MANSLSRAGLEVYTTEPVEDANVTQLGKLELISPAAANSGGNVFENNAVANGTGDNSKLASMANDFLQQKQSEMTEEEKESSSGMGGDDPQNNFVLQTGKILSIDYLGELFSDSYEMDYKDLSSNASISVSTEYLKYFFKGKRCALKKGWGIRKWEDMDTAILGFITEISWNDNQIDMKISGMDKLLDAEAQFDFQQTKRSEVVKQIIEASGLKAKVDPTGLVDDVIDFSTGSSDEEGSGDSTGSASLDEAVNQAIKGKKTPLEKAKAIDKSFKSHVIYSYYYDVHHPDLEEAWQNAHLNCADGANVLCAMFIKAKLKAVIVHVPSHYIVKLTIDGKTYYTDNAASDGQHTTRAFGEVWRGNTSGTEVGTRISA